MMCGQTKIDSVQNVITLRSDLHEAWDNYEFGVDPTVSGISYYMLRYSKLDSLSSVTTASLHLPMAMQT